MIKSNNNSDAPDSALYHAVRKYLNDGSASTLADLTEIYTAKQPLDHNVTTNILSQCIDIGSERSNHIVKLLIEQTTQENHSLHWNDVNILALIQLLQQLNPISTDVTSIIKQHCQVNQSVWIIRRIIQNRYLERHSHLADIIRNLLSDLLCIDSLWTPYDLSQVWYLDTLSNWYEQDEVFRDKLLLSSNAIFQPDDWNNILAYLLANGLRPNTLLFDYLKDKINDQLFTATNLTLFMISGSKDSATRLLDLIPDHFSQFETNVTNNLPEPETLIDSVKEYINDDTETIDHLPHLLEEILYSYNRYKSNQCYRQMVSFIEAFKPIANRPILTELSLIYLINAISTSQSQQSAESSIDTTLINLIMPEENEKAAIHNDFHDIVSNARLCIDQYTLEGIVLDKSAIVDALKTIDMTLFTNRNRRPQQMRSP
ncbi:MAG: hypothetical protein CMF46_00050 [Legionellales bacterium]|nr:hypothetical protein [Legionellales bacterium]|tara:strand:+ start:642 stop:1928 length:1287 start_codon:yes stop_codon:yes gene_type:complete